MYRGVKGLTAVAAVGLLGLGAGPAEAHPALLVEEPAAGAVLREPPGRLLYRFDEAIEQVVALQVTAPDGSRVATLPPTVAGEVLEQPLPRLLLPGVYVVVRTVRGADGDVVTERSEFSVATGRTAGSVPTGEPDGADAVPPATGGEDEERAVQPLLAVFLGLAALALAAVTVARAGAVVTAPLLRRRADR